MAAKFRDADLVFDFAPYPTLKLPFCNLKQHLVGGGKPQSEFFSSVFPREEREGVKGGKIIVLKYLLSHSFTMQNFFEVQIKLLIYVQVI